jgi:LacI family transcriptional regulator
VLIAASTLTDRHARWLARAPVPTVLVNCEVTGGSLDSALSDNREGGRRAAAHLLGLGHRRLGYLAVSHPDTASAEREQGVRDALAEAGEDPAALVVTAGDSHVAGGDAAMRAMLEGGGRVSAVACYNDLMAIGALRALRSTGCHVPEDVSVVGFDNIDLARYAEPALTTIAQDITGLGRWAVDRLLLRVSAAPDEPQVAPTTLRLPVRLVVRETTAPPRAR